MKTLTAADNLREKAILAILREGKKLGENVLALNATLRGLGDMQIFALHIDVFGYAVGEEAVQS